MGKGGAPTTTNTAQNQTVQYTPTGLSGFQNIYDKASQVASTPYQPYGGQLVQGLNNTQTGAINQISNIAGSPLSQGQIQQYMNPFQNNVIDATMANINETNQQQQAQTTGQLTQAAGGIGADRIGIGQAELARQQALASNQTLAGLQQQNYAQGLGAAQQQQGFGLGAAQTQLGAGGLQQQTGQAGLTAAYQQYLQQLAFPYQQTQFLAGIGLPALGAMGGTQQQTGTANQVMTPPGMSWLQGLAGAGALGYGLTSGMGSGSPTTSPESQALPATSAQGGRVNSYDDGGGVSPGEEEALAPVLGKSGYVPQVSMPSPGSMANASRMPMQMPSMAAPQQQSQQAATQSGLSDLGGTIAKLAPLALAFLKTGGAAPSGYDDGGMVPQPQQSMGQAPGMNTFPSPAMLGRPLTQGALPTRPQMGSPNVSYGTPLPNMLPPYPVARGQTQGSGVYEQMRQMMLQQQLGQRLAASRQQMAGEPDVNISAQEYSRGGYAHGGDAEVPPWDAGDDMGVTPPPATGDQFADRFAGAPAGAGALAGVNAPIKPQPQDRYGFPVSQPTPMPPGRHPGPHVTVNPNLPAQREAENTDSTPNVTSTLPDNVHVTTDAGLPQVPTEINRPTVRGLMTNPDFWTRAGLNILASNPAHGPLSAIAAGATGTIGEYDKWSAEDLTAKQKGMELAGKLKAEADKYTKITPTARAKISQTDQHIALENQKIQEDKRWHDILAPGKNAAVIHAFTQSVPGAAAMSPEQQAVAAQRWAANLPQDPGVGHRKNNTTYMTPQGPMTWTQ